MLWQGSCRCWFCFRVLPPLLSLRPKHRMSSVWLYLENCSEQQNLVTCDTSLLFITASGVRSKHFCAYSQWRIPLETNFPVISNLLKDGQIPIYKSLLQVKKKNHKHQPWHHLHCLCSRVPAFWLPCEFSDVPLNLPTVSHLLFNFQIFGLLCSKVSYIAVSWVFW